ncbi:hypothetical protein IQ250_15080 [Pseudanabaenaceae cyanobacterium LEGE 13415]|nr:hypothetical protein [Pseudanabaenaceae cyanobacterium LEGE 13415]
MSKLNHTFAQKLKANLLNFSFRQKLAFALITAAIVPTGVVSYSLIQLSEQQLLEKMHRVLETDLSVFQQQQQQLETQHLLMAEGLTEEIKLPIKN